MKTDTMTGLELRKAACEALGWRRGNGYCCNVAPSLENPGWHHPKCECVDSELVDCNCYNAGENPDGCTYCQSDCAHQHSEECQIDPPEITEPMFLEWCAKNELLWDLYSARDGQISCAVYKPDHNGVHAHVFGANPSEARARAIIAANRKES